MKIVEELVEEYAAIAVPSVEKVLQTVEAKNDWMARSL